MKHIPSVSPGQVKKVLKAAGQGRKKAKKVRRCRAVIDRGADGFMATGQRFGYCPNPALSGGDFCEEHKA